MAAGGTLKDRVPHVLPPRPPGGSAILDEGHSARFQEDLILKEATPSPSNERTRQNTKVLSQTAVVIWSARACHVHYFGFVGASIRCHPANFARRFSRQDAYSEDPRPDGLPHPRRIGRSLSHPCHRNCVDGDLCRDTNEITAFKNFRQQS